MHQLPNPVRDRNGCGNAGSESQKITLDAVTEDHAVFRHQRSDHKRRALVGLPEDEMRLRRHAWEWFTHCAMGSA